MSTSLSGKKNSLPNIWKALLVGENLFFDKGKLTRGTLAALSPFICDVAHLREILCPI